MLKVCKDCGIGLEERTLQSTKCSRAQLHTSCCNCRAGKGKCFLKCEFCSQRCAVFSRSIAHAVVMASHSRLGALSPMRMLLLHLEPQLIRLIVEGGSMRGATAARAPPSNSEAEVCVPFLQLGRCVNGENCRFSHASPKVKGGGQLPPGYVFEQDELKFFAPSDLPSRISYPLNLPANLSPLASTLSKIRRRAEAWRPLGWKHGENQAENLEGSRDDEVEVDEYGAETSAFCFRACRQEKAAPSSVRMRNEQSAGANVNSAVCQGQVSSKIGSLAGGSMAGGSL